MKVKQRTQLIQCGDVLDKAIVILKARARDSIIRYVRRSFGGSDGWLVGWLFSWLVGRSVGNA